MGRLNEPIKEFGEVQVAGVFFYDFMDKLKPYVDAGWTYDVNSVMHHLPSTFVVTVTKEKGSVQDQVTQKPARRQQKAVDKQE